MHGCMQGKLSNSQFARFKKQSAAWQQGKLAAAAYHEELLQLGLLTYIGDLMAICPNEQKRDALLQHHSAYLEQGARLRWTAPAAHCCAAAGTAYMLKLAVQLTQHIALLLAKMQLTSCTEQMPAAQLALASINPREAHGTGAGGTQFTDQAWAPPEALQAAAASSNMHTSWRCAMCELLNAPTAEKCERCATHKMVTDAQRAEERMAAERDAAGASAKKRGKGTKMAWADLHSPAKSAGAWRR